MLQQTQVATVKPYFERFMAALPTIASLAAAPEQQVLRLWEGLGYYQRARQLHRAASAIVRDHGGAFPRDFEAVRRLPGIGRYTAGAILSIALDQRLPILEANTTRLFCRLLAYGGPTSASAGQRLLWAMAKAVLPRRGVGTFNQALMELGSEVCLARSPRCGDCPVAPLCEANLQALQQQIPAAKKRPTFEVVREAAVIVRRREKVLLVRCPEGARWAGLWDFPRFAVMETDPAGRRRALAESVRRLTGVDVEIGEHVKSLKHGVTRFRITLDCYEATFVSGELNGCAAAMKWLRPADLETHPLSSTGRKLARLASSHNLPSCGSRG
jgi:A/G-specific adenine glycosylase